MPKVNQQQKSPLQMSQKDDSISPSETSPIISKTDKLNIDLLSEKIANNSQTESQIDQKLLLDESIEELSAKDKGLLVNLCLINLFANSAYSSIAPFYPGEAIAKGVPEWSIGLVFSSYSISMAIFAPIFASLLYKRGPKQVLIVGCLCEGISMIVFGLLVYVVAPVIYACLSFLCRFLEGFGNGCLNSACKFIQNLLPFLLDH